MFIFVLYEQASADPYVYEILSPLIYKASYIQDAVWNNVRNTAASWALDIKRNLNFIAL